MRVSISEAEATLAELIRRAEAGEEVVLTRDGKPAVRLVPENAKPDRAAKRAVLDAVRASAAGKVTPGPDAARSQDFLYDDDGLPG
ncbi:type II toxin-antitoxin system Phd/YefM family antitoxin [Lutibaculum baratangense]|uniref:Antitoxin n=1 Tax=Lutibaculum baratangense AMV1 TaxID=631454 RepID=V4RL04_9HYPH|nr:type II toxin-antitoxin system prevent-host-death family antitoxin [Lutibaculum baratangense]ESR26746.1 hypothetical protein N177_0530 [Lutibaculum baratangense AMV1]